MKEKFTSDTPIIFMSFTAVPPKSIPILLEFLYCMLYMEEKSTLQMAQCLIRCFVLYLIT